MTTAEKRAAVEAAGEPWPTCECHGEGMGWQKSSTCTAGGYFYCRTVRRTNTNRRRELRRTTGLCIDCGHPNLETGVCCRPCADARADRMATPKARIKHRAVLARSRMRGRAAEGFQPTGAGAVLFVALTGER